MILGMNGKRNGRRRMQDRCRHCGSLVRLKIQLRSRDRSLVLHPLDLRFWFRRISLNDRLSLALFCGLFGSAVADYCRGWGWLGNGRLRVIHQYPGNIVQELCRLFSLDRSLVCQLDSLEFLGFVQLHAAIIGIGLIRRQSLLRHRTGGHLHLSGSRVLDWDRHLSFKNPSLLFCLLFCGLEGFIPAAQSLEFPRDHGNRGGPSCVLLHLLPELSEFE